MKIYFVLLVANTLLITSLGIAQDTKMHQTSIAIQNIKNADDSFLVKSGFKKLRQDIKTGWDKVFKNYTGNEFSLFAGMNYATQNVKANGYSSNYIYNLTNNKDAKYNPGFMGGFRVDGKYKENTDYGFAVSLNRMVTGVNYQETKSFAPLVGTYSNFKPDTKLLLLNITPLYKKLVPIKDTSNYKLYAVGGPSIDFLFSSPSADNKATDAYRKVFLSAKVGLEFNNQTFYTLFIHYKHGLQSITKSPITNNFNSFELGMFIRASDL